MLIYIFVKVCNSLNIAPRIRVLNVDVNVAPTECAHKHNVQYSVRCGHIAYCQKHRTVRCICNYYSTYEYILRTILNAQRLPKWIRFLVILFGHLHKNDSPDTHSLIEYQLPIPRLQPTIHEYILEFSVGRRRTQQRHSTIADAEF